jgi:hypothetical protein
MALNLSTLTSSATSGDVLAEALTTADFLDSVPILANLANRGNKGGDAKQTTALNQPKALPLIKNPAGNLGGYLYIPDVVGNYAEGPSVTIGSNETWEGELDMVITQWGAYVLPMGGGVWASGFGLIFRADSQFRVFSKGNPTSLYVSNSVNLGTSFNVKYGYNGTEIYADINGVREYTATPNSQSGSITHNLQLNQQATITHEGNYAIQKAKLTVNSAVVFDCDFNGSTSIRHGDTKFQASVGGPVTINQSGNDPATVIKKSVLRFDGVNDGLRGLFANNINGGYMFAAFSVLGTGGGNDSRVFSVNANGAADVASTGFIYGLKYGGSPWLASYGAGAYRWAHVDMYDDARGDIVYEAKAKSGGLISKVNGANKFEPTTTLAISSDEFTVGNRISFDRAAAIDLQFLGLFPATITDAQADSVRNYINNRNNVFSLIDSQGYYFYNSQSAPIGAISSGSSAWNGRIVGSDNGDTDKLATQSTANDQPVSDGYVVTFADNSDHLDIPSTTQAGWQVVGTSLGTFVYRVDSDAVTELNLLGNYGFSARQIGQLYGVILLPDSATGADIEQSRRLLIDRGAADAPSVTSVQDFWRNRYDIVEFKHLNFTNVTNFLRAWRDADSINNFDAINAPNGNSFSSAWQGTTALTSFPAGAKLGTSAQNVNFTSAWQDSGLTSFPADIDLSKGINFANTWRQSGLTSFPAIQSTLNGRDFFAAWYFCQNLTSFGAANLNASQYFSSSWQSCANLEDFPALFTDWNPSSIVNGVFNNTWDGCTSLTANSVEAILTSIDASNQHGTDDGTSTGNPLGDSGIDIDYNTATGSLSAATNSAVTSLKAKGWSIIVNNVTL